MTRQKLRRPHVVPKGYQKNFADGKRILVIERATGAEQLVGIRDNFVASHFLRTIVDGVASDAAEDVFGDIENVALPLIRTIRVGVPMDKDQHLALKATMAMLWARSLSREAVAQRIHERIRATYPEQASNKDIARAGFRQQHGRDPEPGELEAIARQAADEMRAERVADVRLMLQHHDEALKRFLPMPVSLLEAPPDTEFVTSDNPLLIARSGDASVVGTHNGVALDAASFIFLPISRRVGACMTDGLDDHVQLDRPAVAFLNNGTWRNAVARIACHPSLKSWRQHCNLASADPASDDAQPREPG